MTVAENIRRYRRLRDMTQEELSGQIGVSLKTIQRWENGGRSPRLKDMHKLSEVLGVSSDEILGEASTVPSVGTDSALLSNPDSTDTERLIYRNGVQTIALPNTPETRELFKELVTRMAGRESPAMV